MNTALALVDRSSRLLYPIESRGDIPFTRAWLEEVQGMMHAVIPVAHGIAREKGQDTTTIAHITQLLSRSESLLEDGDEATAGPMLLDAYAALQAVVAGMRSGDELKIALPAGASQQTWDEARRRYEDWRYTADWMAMSAAEMGVDASLIEAGNVQAKSLFDQASRHAQDRNWDQALATIDQVYSVMETAWRSAGIDI